MRLIGAVLALTCAQSLCYARGGDLPPMPELNRLFDVSASTVQALALPSGDAWAPFAATVDLGGQHVELVLEPHRVRSADYFQVQTMDEAGRVTMIDAPAPTTYKGSILGQPGARVRASLVDGRLHATIRLPDGDAWVVQPIDGHVPGAPRDAHIVFRAADSTQRGGLGCPVGTGGEFEPAARRGRTPLAPAGGEPTEESLGPTVKLCEVAFEVDYEYYVLMGASTTAVFNDVENVMNSVEGMYENEGINIQFEVTTINVRTANAAPYMGVTNPGTLLDTLAAEWSSNNPALGSTMVRRDVVHMFTNKAIDSFGGTLGIAYLNGACTTGPSSAAFGLSKSRWSGNFNNRISVTSHEIAHNMSATHCNVVGGACTGQPTCGTMCASVNNCGSNVLFGACSAGQIAAFRDSGSGACMGTLPSPIAGLPFLDPFASAGINTTNWVWNYNTGVTVPIVALQPAPSPDRVMVLNALTSSGQVQRDQIRSNFINLAGAPVDTELSFYWAQNGAPAGATLIVEYWANTLRWLPVTTLTSDGSPTSADYTLHRFTVPTAGRHAEFRVRFTVGPGNTLTQHNWYVDNVRVGTPLPTACSIADITAIGGTAEDPGEPDGLLTLDDILVFTDLYSDSTGCPGAVPCNRADITGLGGPPEAPDGQLTLDDILEFINAFNAGC